MSNVGMAAGGAWAEFCRPFAAAGVRREPWEGPIRFGERAARRFPEHRAAIIRVTDLYARVRYSAEPPPARELVAAVRAMPRLRKPEAKTP